MAEDTARRSAETGSCNAGRKEWQPLPADSVFWSSDIASLADRLLEELAQSNAEAQDPFRKNCIVINSPATEKWLKEYFLLHKKTPQVLFNLDFAELPEFINDWLWAVVRQKPPRERRADRHPFSKSILTWRIYRILEQSQPGEGLDELLDYVGENPENRARRRSALAEKLATLYDDYLNSRFRMLREWEKKGSSRSDVPDWQITLYRKLVGENDDTYARQYETALAEPDGSGKACRCGFPDYLSVHVFDIPFIPEPTLRLLEKISRTFPMKFWNFNPTGAWLGETPSSGENARRLRANMRKMLEIHCEALESGDVSSLADDVLSDCFETGENRENAFSPSERLLGSMASGARGVISALCSDFGGNVEVLPPGETESVEAPAASISVHSTYSPRRELEAVRDGLHEFFRTHKDAAPHDALVLCADWEHYAPVLDMVFPPWSGTDDPPPGYIPIAAESMPGSSPIMESFGELLKFRSNRFEKSAVLSLLKTAAIRRRRDLGEDAVEILRQMIRPANIHWGADPEDVKEILAVSGEEKNCPFTWQRGFDRLTAELLHGFDTDDLLKDAGGGIGPLHPCGHVEGERAEYVAALWSLVRDLMKLRREKLPKGKTLPVDDIRDSVLWTVDTFYDESEDKCMELGKIRQAASAVADHMRDAGITGIDNEVFIGAVLHAVNGHVAGRKSSVDAVSFAPLNCYTATPRKFIWICGLNDGIFPRTERRAADDAIGRHPTLFDVSLREQDAFALLKAVCGAREQLCCSYVGRDSHTNETIPPTVLLENLTDYLKISGRKFSRYEHPLQGYDRRCFGDGEKLPPSCSGICCDVAGHLASEREVPRLIPFPLAKTGVTEIALDDLASFFALPNACLLRKYQASVPWLERNDDSECLDARLDKELKARLTLEEMTDEAQTLAAELSVESGNAPDETAAREQISRILNRKRPISFTKRINGRNEVVYSCLDENKKALDFTETYLGFLQQPEAECAVDLSVRGKAVRIISKYRTIRLRAEAGGQTADRGHVICFYDDIYDSTKNGIMVRHLAANAALGGNTATLAFSPGGKTACLPLSQEDAQKGLTTLLELASGQWPEGYPDFGKGGNHEADKLPEEWQAALSGTVHII